MKKTHGSLSRTSRSTPVGSLHLERSALEVFYNHRVAVLIRIRMPSVECRMTAYRSTRAVRKNGYPTGSGRTVFGLEELRSVIEPSDQVPLDWPWRWRSIGARNGEAVPPFPELFGRGRNSTSSTSGTASESAGDGVWNDYSKGICGRSPPVCGDSPPHHMDRQRPQLWKDA